MSVRVIFCKFGNDKEIVDKMNKVILLFAAVILIVIATVIKIYFT